MKKLILCIALCLTCYVIVAQDLIKPIKGKSFFATNITIDDDKVYYQRGSYKTSMQKADIALIEFIEGGVEYFNTDSLQIINPEDIDTPFEHGNKVYIPFSSTSVAQRSGALKLRELISDSKLWEIVDCEEEAHFIIVFVYSDRGKDHGFAEIKARNGTVLHKTPDAYDSGFIPSTKGEEIAEKLFTKYISKGRFSKDYPIDDVYHFYNKE